MFGKRDVIESGHRQVRADDQPAFLGCAHDTQSHQVVAGRNGCRGIRAIEQAARLPATEASFSLFVPIPGTDIHAAMIDQGYALSTDYTDYDYYARQPFQGAIDRRELRMIQRWAYLRFYTHPYRWPSLARTAGSRSGLRSVGRKLLRILPQGRGAHAAPGGPTAASVRPVPAPASSDPPGLSGG